MARFNFRSLSSSIGDELNKAIGIEPQKNEEGAEPDKGMLAAGMAHAAQQFQKGSGIEIGADKKENTDKGKDDKPDSFFSSVTEGLEKSAKKAFEGAEKHVDHVLGIPSESKTESKSKGNFDDLKQVGGAALEGGKELFGHVGKGLFERLEKSSVVLGAEHVLGAIPKGISGFVQEAEGAGKTAFGLSNESRAQTSLGIPSFSADRQPAPVHSMGQPSVAMQVRQAFKDLRNLGQELGEDRMPVRLSVLGRQQGAAPTLGVEQGVGFPARSMSSHG